MKKTKKSQKCISLFAFFALTIALISAIIYFIASKSMAFAEWIAVNIGHPMRAVLAKITSTIPFSVAECLIIFSPIALALIIIFAAKQRGAPGKIRYLISVFAAISLILSMYTYTLGVGYYREPAYEKIGLESSDPTKEELYKTLIVLRNECETLIGELEFSDSGSSVSPLEIDKMCEQICRGYELLAEEYPELSLEIFDSYAKPVGASSAMTALDILGIYTFFTGESNINVHYPDYTTPFTVAHEFAHQRGIARENEANFTAFLVCTRADDPYIRYSGYINMFEYVASALARTDKELLREVYAETDERIIGEMRACNDFYNENRSVLLGKISEFFNDNYLKLQGNGGTVSYSMVVKLCVSYYRNK